MKVLHVSSHGSIAVLKCFLISIITEKNDFFY